MWRGLICCLTMFAGAADALQASVEVQERPEAAVVVGASATELEVFAAKQLCGYLDKLYAIRTSPSTEVPPAAKIVLLVGGPETNPTARKVLGAKGWPKLSD